MQYSSEIKTSTKLSRRIKRLHKNRKEITYDNHIKIDDINLPINNNENQGSYLCILERIHNQLTNLLSYDKNLVAVRIDIRFKKEVNESEISDQLISNFIKDIKSQLVKKYKIKHKKIMHIWAREIESSNTPHYHTVLALPERNVKSSYGINQVIQDLCASKKYQIISYNLVKDHDYYINNNHDDNYKEAFERFSYLAKIKSKDKQPENKRNYSASQIKPKHSFISFTH